MTTADASDAQQATIPPDQVMIAFTGKLTRRENWKWALSVAWRRATRRYLRVVVPATALVVILAFFNNRHSRQSPLQYVGTPLIVINLFAALYILAITIPMMWRVARADPHTRGDTTVRFYQKKIELLFDTGLLTQLPYGTVRLRRTSLGVACETVGGAPILLLPWRVLSQSEAEQILALSNPSEARSVG